MRHSLVVAMAWAAARDARPDQGSPPAIMASLASEIEKLADLKAKGVFDRAGVRASEGGGPYSTWTSLDVAAWQNTSSLLLIVVSTVPRPLKAVVIDLTALTETLLRPNATAAVDLQVRQ